MDEKQPKKGGPSGPADRRSPVPLAVDYDQLIAAIADSHGKSQHQAAQAVNAVLTVRNWMIGYHIVEYEQHGSDRAKYGQNLLARLAEDLKKQLGRGFGQRNLLLFREFYRRYPILQSVIAKFDTGPPSSATPQTRPIAQSLIAQLETEESTTPIRPAAPLDWQDEAYFNRLFSEFSWTHFIAMNFYLNYLKAEEIEADEQDPVGVILCSDKNETHVEYALGGLNNQVFVSR